MKGLLWALLSTSNYLISEISLLLLLGLSRIYISEWLHACCGRVHCCPHWSHNHQWLLWWLHPAYTELWGTDDNRVAKDCLKQWPRCLAGMQIRWYVIYFEILTRYHKGLIMCVLSFRHKPLTEWIQTHQYLPLRGALGHQGVFWTSWLS